MSVVLSEHLPLLATAPDGIRKLRGLILELAVRGKLVPQDAADEPAGELLKRIAAAKSLLEVTTGSKKLKPQPPISEDEHPFQVPDGWEWSHLADLTQVLNGRAYSKAELLDAGTPVLRVGNLFTSNHWYYSDLTLEPEKYCDAGDLIFSWSASFGPFIWQGPKVIYHYHIWKLELFDKRSFGKEFLYKFLLEKTAEIKAAGHGVSMVHMTKEKMEKIPVPVPPLAEQHRIVAKVDELMALCDRLEAEQADAASAHARLVETLLGTLTQSTDAADLAANWQRLAEHFDTLFTTEASIDALKQTVLQLAVMGKLVPQDPNDEPASELLKNIAQERTRLEREGVCKKSKAMPPVGADDQLFALPSTWMWARLGSVSVTSTGKTPATSKAEYYEGTLPFIGPGQLTPEGEILPPEKRLSDAGADETTLANPGDILMVCIGGSIGKAAIASMKIAFNQQINCASPILISSRYLYAVMICHFFQKIALAKATGSATPIINRSNWDEIPLPLAPLAEQHRIVAKVDELMALCNRLKADVATARQHQATLADTLIDTALEAA